MTLVPEQLVFTRQAIRAVDAQAVEQWHIPAVVLMENAARALAGQALAMLGDGGRGVLLVCGPGNNGGDGFAAARHLHNAGCSVTVVHLRPAGDYTGDAKINLDILGGMDLVVLDGSGQPIEALRRAGPCDLLVDCLFGTGLSRPVRAPMDAVIRWMNHQAAPILACDIPSGLDCDTGRPLGLAVRAEVTVSFVGWKKGFCQPGASTYTGQVVVGDIGVPVELAVRHAEGRVRPTPFGRPLGRLYDVFVDWPGRLGREMPGIRAVLESVGARKVLDVGCATGRHVQALRQAGYQCLGCDASQAMLDQAAELLGGAEGLYLWAMGQPEPASLAEAGPFDAIVCLGNTWPQVIAEEQVRAAGQSLYRLLRPGGLLLVGMKALAERRRAGQPYLPLLKRRQGGRPMYFVRFVDFDHPPVGGVTVGQFHMVVAEGGAADQGMRVLRHTAGLQRVWSVEQLQRFFESVGFRPVQVSGDIGRADEPPAGEDVFIHARRP